jgi:hypothetical protein
VNINNLSNRTSQTTLPENHIRERPDAPIVIGPMAVNDATLRQLTAITLPQAQIHAARRMPAMQHLRQAHQDQQGQQRQQRQQLHQVAAQPPANAGALPPAVPLNQLPIGTILGQLLANGILPHRPVNLVNPRTAIRQPASNPKDGG